MNNNQKSQVMALRQQGLGYLKISKLLNLPLTTIKSYCKRNSIDKDSQQTVSCSDVSYCKYCAKELTQTPHHRKKLFCDDSCRMSWWAEHPQCRRLK